MVIKLRFSPGLLAILLMAKTGFAQTPSPTDGPPTVAPAVASTPAVINSGRTAPAYPLPYPPPKVAEIKAVLDRVLGYLERASPVRVINRDTREAVADLTRLPPNPALDRTDFLLTSYEWGVTYSGILQVAAVTHDQRYAAYTKERLGAIAMLATHLKNQPPGAEPAGPQRLLTLRSVLAPGKLDDCGSMCAAMIKASRAGMLSDVLRPWIDNYMEWICRGQYRLSDGTLARQRPFPNTLWLDDLYMSVPALAQMGALTGDRKYFADAVKQVRQFSARMFVPEKGLYRHGWVEAMEPHPAFYWGRANGWAIVAMTELLELLPDDDPDRPAVLGQYRSLARGLAQYQDSSGLWHQLLDRPDSYLETSASAMYVYAIAHGINRGWLDGSAYGPMVSVAWNAVAKKVNAEGQVEGTCVGTGMGFEPTFYCFRPVSVYAAHGYGPLLLAGAEMIALREGRGRNLGEEDGSLLFGPPPSRF